MPSTTTPHEKMEAALYRVAYCLAARQAGELFECADQRATVLAALGGYPGPELMQLKALPERQLSALHHFFTYVTCSPPYKRAYLTSAHVSVTMALLKLLVTACREDEDFVIDGALDVWQDYGIALVLDDGEKPAHEHWDDLTTMIMKICTNWVSAKTSPHDTAMEDNQYAGHMATME